MSVADPNQSSAIAITAVPPISLSVQPQQVSALPGQDLTFTVTEPSGQTQVSFVAPGIPTSSFDATISYQAPTTPGAYNLVVISALDPAQRVTIALTVVPITGFFISPQRYVLASDTSIPIHAFAQTALGLQDLSSQVTWSTTAGQVYSGYFVAPATPGTCLVSAQMNGSAATAQATMMVVASEVFSPETPMAIPRSGHSVTRLLDGRVLVAGGKNWENSPNPLNTTSAEIYDPATRAFTTLASSMTVARSGHTATLLGDGRVLLVGGATAASAELFDPVAGSFTATEAPPFYNRSNHFGILLPDGRVLIAGGNDGASGRSLELFDPGTGAFIPAGVLLTPNNPGEGAATLLADGRVCSAPGCLDQRLALRRLPGDPSLAGFLGCAAA
jgi:hypothetical protein